MELPKIIKQTLLRIHVVKLIHSFSCKVASPFPSVCSKTKKLGNILSDKVLTYLQKNSFTYYKT